MQQRDAGINPWSWLLIAAAGLALVLGACDNGDDDDGADPDAGDDAGEWICPDVEWGSGMSTGSAVSNWTMQGYIDSDLDGVVELEEVEFTLEDIHCTGKQSLVVMWGDTS